MRVKRVFPGAKPRRGGLNLAQGKRSVAPGLSRERHCGLKGHFKNDRRRGFEVPFQGTWMRADGTQGCASLALGYGASGPLGRR